MSTNPAKVKELGEIAIRCSDLQAMFEFYSRIVGLEVLSDNRDEGIVFFKICNGYGGHITVLALFLPWAGRKELHPTSRTPPETGARSSLHHLALTIDWEDREKLRKWLTEQNVDYQVQFFDWIGWEGTFIEDPEGNTVEFVAAVPQHSAIRHE